MVLLSASNKHLSLIREFFCFSLSTEMESSGMSSTKKINFATQTRAGLLDHKLPVNNVTVFHLGIANQKVDKRPAWTSHGGGGATSFLNGQGTHSASQLLLASAWCEEC